MMAFKEKYLVVYPNPVQDMLTVGINVQDEKIKQLDILDEQGKLVLSEQVNSSSTQLSVKHLPKGLYFVQVTNQNGDVKTEKFLKE
jgi:hypothetical protein